MGENKTSIERPIGSQGQELAQSAVAPYPLLVNVAPGVPLAVDVTDRAARLLGVTYGSQAAQLQQKVATLELLVEDTGLNTNPERWLQIYHWEQRQVTIAAAGAGGAQNLGGVVGAGLRRRIRSLKLRHDGTENTFFTLFSGATVVDSWGVPAQTTRVIGDEDGWDFEAGEQSSIQTSSVVGGVGYVSARGVEASPV